MWGKLPTELTSSKTYINWFHFFIPSNQVKNFKFANSLKDKFNLNDFENHNFINSYMNLNNFIKCYFQYIGIYFKNIFLLKTKLSFFKNKYSKCNFSFFLNNDYSSSFFGPSLIYNIMNIQIFDNLLKNIPKQECGLYIIENQSWEYCFIKLWKKYKHGRLSAYFNSSVRFWDLRYLKKKQELILKSENPDKYLINKNILKNEVRKLGYPVKKIIKTEALRYEKLKTIKKINKNKKILIVGDILLNETFNLLKFINATTNSLSSYKFYFKPHPTMTSSSIKYLKDNFNFFNIVNINSNKFNYFQFVICSNGTSANLDCMIMNINFCSIKSFNSLNLFPVEKYQNKFQVLKKEDLINKIKKLEKFNQSNLFTDKVKSEKIINLFK